MVKNFVANSSELGTEWYVIIGWELIQERMISMRSWDPPFWIGDRLFTEEEMTLITYTVRQFKQLSRQELQVTI